MFGKIDNKTDICTKSKMTFRNNVSLLKDTAKDNCMDDNYDVGF
jgi:hypothetical protein